MKQPDSLRQVANQLHPIATKILEAAFMAAKAATDEDKARIAWRMSDYLWGSISGGGDIAFARAFNDVCQKRDFPWVKDLWSETEKLTAAINRSQRG